MKHFKFSHCFAAIALAACLAFTGCKPAEDTTAQQVLLNQLLVTTYQQAQNTYATLLSGTWRSQYNDGYTISATELVYDDGGYGYGWTRTIVEFSDKYIYTKDTNGKFYAVSYENLSGSSCKFANAYKSGGKTSADSLLEAKLVFTKENGYYGMYGTYARQ